MNHQEYLENQKKKYSFSFTNAYKKKDFISIHKSLEDISHYWSATHHYISLEQIDTAITTIKRTRRLTQDEKQETIQLLDALKTHKTFYDACKHLDLPSIENFLNETNTYLHLEQIDNGLRLVREKIGFRNDFREHAVYIYLESIANDYSNSFIKSIENNDISYLKNHLPNYIYLNSSPKYQEYCYNFLQSLLYTAVECNNIEIVDYLATSKDLKKLAQLDSDHYQALNIAKEKGYKSLVNYLLNHEQTNLRQVSSHFQSKQYTIDPEIASYLKSYSNFSDLCDKNLKDIKHILCNSNTQMSLIAPLLNTILSSNECTEFTKITNNFINKVYLASCEYGSLELVETLINKNDNLSVSYEYFAGFKRACLEGHIDIVEYLLSLGNINKESIEEGALKACKFGHLDIFKRLEPFIFENSFLYNFSHDAFKEAALSGKKEILSHITEGKYYPYNNVHQLSIKNEYELLEAVLFSSSNSKDTVKSLYFIIEQLPTIHKPEDLDSMYKYYYNEKQSNIADKEKYYTKLFLKSLETEKLDVIKFLLNSDKTKQYIKLPHQEYAILNTLCKYNHLAAIEYFVCELNLPRTKEVDGFFEQVITFDKHFSEEQKNAIKYTEKLYDMIKLNKELHQQTQYTRKRKL